MKTILASIILIVGCYLTASSQSGFKLGHSRLRIDTTLNGSLLKNDLKLLPPGKSNDVEGLFADRTGGLKNLSPKLPDKKVVIGYSLSEHQLATATFDRMPCLKPQGFSPMPVLVPDSTIKYNLLIKK